MFDYGVEAFLADTKLSGRVGLVTNNTGRDRHGIHTADRIQAHGKLELKAIFSPEHGFGSDAPDGEAVDSSKHPKFGVPIISLYGTRKKPSPQDLEGLDLLVYDIQDVGVRFYTYISTLRNILESAAECGLPMHVLDRPDLLGGESVEGPNLTEGFSSFIGHLPVPLRYGLTCGELAGWWNHRMGNTVKLTVWRCRNWKRGMAFENLGVPWVKPSPSMSTTATARFYPGTCLFEGTNLSEGRGTEAPFQIIGAPWINADLWLEKLVPLLPPSVTATKAAFKPTFSKFTGEECRGIKLATRNYILYKSVDIGIRAIHSLIRTHPGKVAFEHRGNFRQPFFDYLAGNSWLREGLAALEPINKLEERAGLESLPFTESRRAFFLYPSGSI